MKNNKPILVTGSHRSGTTWIGQTISQLPGIRYIHEPFNVTYPYNATELKLDTWFSHYQSSSQKEEIESFFNNLLQLNPFSYAVKKCKNHSINLKTPFRFGKHLLSELFLSQRILIKDPIALLSAGWLHESYDFKVIVMIRNPFAFVGSLKKALWDFDFVEFRKQKVLMQGLLHPFHGSVESMCMKGDRNDLIDRAILLWNLLHFIILEYQNQYPEWLYVKHEDIARNPKSGFNKIFNYLRLPINSEIGKYIETYTSESNPKEAASTSYQPINSQKSIHTWKERLTIEEIERVKTGTNEIFSHFYDKLV